jgi:HSP20 family protein
VPCLEEYDGGTLAGVADKRNLDQLQREVQELFSDLWQVPRFSGLRAGFRPHVDCFRTDDALTVLVELPGIDPEKVDLFVADGALYLLGNRGRPRFEGQVYQQMELDYGPFRRQVALGADVDVAQAQATYEKGILTIVLPLAQRPAPGERVAIEVKRA